jgi:magnesium-dependent phosphatase 1
MAFEGFDRPPLKLGPRPAHVPELVVFDLDDCLWSPEMYTLRHVPDTAVRGDLGGGCGDGVLRAKASALGGGRGPEVSLFSGAREVMQSIWAGELGDDVRCAAASSADTPQAVRCAHGCLALLEVVPGVTMLDFFGRNHAVEVLAANGHLQIGRSPPLSSDKTTHFALLQRNTGVAFEKMVFFDDCNWGDNCARVARGCKGVVTQKTPHGLCKEAWALCLAKYVEAVERRA